MSDAAQAPQLAFQRNMLRILEERASALHIARDDAREALRRAQFTADTLEANIGDVDGRIVALRAPILELQSRLDPRVMVTLPIDILRLVVTCLAADMAASWTWNSTHAWDTTQLDQHTPYTMSAVCRRWRREALNTSALWSFIVVDQLDSRTPEHVATMVQRSATASLSVVIDWSQYAWAFTTSDGEAVLDSLSTAARRWRRLLIMVPNGSGEQTDIVSALLRRPTPLLEDLVVFSNLSDPRDNDKIVYYLPHCPRLQKLQLSYVSFVCRHIYQPISSLVILDLEADVPGLDVWRILQHTPGLKFLKLSLAERLDNFLSPLGRLALPALHRLSCRMWAPDVLNAWSAKMDLPRLQFLDLNCPVVGPIGDLVLRARETVTRFQYSDNSGCNVLCAADAAIYGQAQNVTSVHLEDADINHDFFEYLIDHSTWPKMHTITFTEVKGWDSDTAEALIKFVRSRTVCLPDVDAPCRLLRVVIKESEDAPDWLVDQVDFFVDFPV